MESYYDKINKTIKTEDIEDVSEFYEAINRKNLTKKLSDDRPYVYFTMEVYDKGNGIKGEWAGPCTFNSPSLKRKKRERNAKGYC